MIHTSISAHANRNGILARPVALFPLLFTTSGSVLCSEFCEVWETLWIFKVAWGTRDRCPKINKSPTVSFSVGASSFEIWTANLAQSFTVGTLTNSQSFIFGDSNWKFCKVCYPVGPQNLTFRCEHFWLGFFFFLMFLFLVKKIKTCWIYKNIVFANWEKYEVSWNFCLVFIIDFHSCVPGSFDTVTSVCMGYRSERAAAGLGPSGLIFFLFQIPSLFSSSQACKKVHWFCRSFLSTTLAKETSVFIIISWQNLPSSFFTGDLKGWGFWMLKLR